MTSFMHKLILLGFLSLSGYVFYKLAIELKLRNAGFLTVAFLTNPLIIVMTVIDGHNEIAMTFLILTSLYFLLRARYALSIFLLILAIHVKFIYILLSPLFILYFLLNKGYKSLKSGIDGVVALIVFFIITILILWFPFGKESIRAIYQYYKELGQNFWFDSIPFAVYFFLNKAGLAISTNTIGGIFSSVFLILYIYFIYYFIKLAKADKQAIFTVSSFMILSLLFTNYSPFQAWYLLWVIPFILLSRIRLKFLLVFLLSYFLIMTFWKRMSVLVMPMIAIYSLILINYKFIKERFGFTFSLEE